MLLGLDVRGNIPNAQLSMLHARSLPGSLVSAGINHFEHVLRPGKANLIKFVKSSLNHQVCQQVSPPKNTVACFAYGRTGHLSN